LRTAMPTQFGWRKGAVLRDIVESNPQVGGAGNAGFEHHPRPCRPASAWQAKARDGHVGLADIAPAPCDEFFTVRGFGWFHSETPPAPVFHRAEKLTLKKNTSIARKTRHRNRGGRGRRFSAYSHWFRKRLDRMADCHRAAKAGGPGEAAADRIISAALLGEALATRQALCVWNIGNSAPINPHRWRIWPDLCRGFITRCRLRPPQDGWAMISLPRRAGGGPFSTLAEILSPRLAKCFPAALFRNILKRFRPAPSPRSAVKASAAAFVSEIFRRAEQAGGRWYVKSRRVEDCQERAGKNGMNCITGLCCAVEGKITVYSRSRKGGP